MDNNDGRQYYCNWRQTSAERAQLDNLCDRVAEEFGVRRVSSTAVLRGLVALAHREDKTGARVFGELVEQIDVNGRRPAVTS